LLAGLTFCELGNCVVPEIVEAKTGSGAHDLADISLAILLRTTFSGLL
jgi:hypothetical protein